jgi:hypothetical protein
LELRLVLSTANQNEVSQAYLDLLNRPVDPAGLAYWTNQLDQGADRGNIAQQLTHSSEYFANIIIAPAYQKYLGRSPDAQGSAYWVGQMQNHGLTDERLEAGFIGSNEFYQHAGGTDKLWVDAMYTDLLGRPADPGGETYWTMQLANGAQRSDVAYGFADSLERETQRVDADYTHFLRRAADPGGVSYWVGQFAQGATNEDLIAGFIASDEYYALAQQLQSENPLSIVITSPSNGLVTNTNVTVRGQLSGGHSAPPTLEASLDGGPASPVSFNAFGDFSLTTSLPLNRSDDGSHVLHFSATDSLGDPPGSADFNFTLDTAPPIISITSPAQNATEGGNFTLRGQVTDGTSGVALLSAALDSASPAPLSVDSQGHFSLPTSLALDGTVDGPHVVHLRATDAAGNVSTSDFDFTLQTTKPVITFTGAASGLLTNDNMTLTGQVTDGQQKITSLTYAVDSGAFSSVPIDSSGNFTVPATIFALDGSADGQHTIHVEAKDALGRTTQNDFHFTLDTTAPVITVTSPAANAVTKSNITLTGTASDAAGGVASLSAAVDSSDYAPLGLDSQGGFGFPTTLALGGAADGPHAVYLQAIDKAGNVTNTEFDFTLDTTGPTITFSGVSSGQATNHNLALSGQVADAISGAASLADAVDSGAYNSVSFDASGNFALPATTFALDGSADGPHTIHVKATDTLGNSTLVDFNFTLDTRPPAAPTFDLAQATADMGPDNTSATRVTLVGTTDAGATVTLVGTSLSAVASGSGAFQIPNVSLTLGVNSLQVRAADAAGNTSSFSRTVTRSTSTGAQPNAVIVWNQATLDAIQTDATDPLFASRGMAMVQAAVFDAVNAIEGTPAYYVKLTAPPGASVPAAVDAAAHDVLVYLYPDQQATFDALLASQLALLPAVQATTDGQTVGQAAAAAIIAMRANDGSRNFVDFQPSSGPGDWQPTAPAYAPALDPQWANLTPFALTSPSQFDPAGPPALTSAAWAAAVNQVESLGAANSTTRTADQTQIAQFWNDASGTYTPPGHWNAIAQTVAQQEGDSIVDDARLFAELDVSLADAGITAWNTKYDYDTWRPITVIHDPSAADNPAVTADPTWEPFLTTPNFPEYVSGHSTFSTAAATVLGAFFGDNVTFTSTEVTLPGVTRTYSGFNEAAQEAGMSRIYAGIHFEFSNLDGAAAGTVVANYVLNTFNIKADTTPPRIALDTSGLTTDGTANEFASNKNVTITGQVTDNLSGVASLEVQVDGGGYNPVTFNATTGGFSFLTKFALDGSADGAHTIDFEATDNAGNTSAPVALQFALGTKPPTINVSSPAGSGSLTTTSTASGRITTSSPALVALSYQFDSGPTVPISFTANTGSSPANSYTFSNQQLDLSQLVGGSHTLKFTATDAAGNTNTQTVQVSLAGAIPLLITSVMPALGAPDVSVTFRPNVTFSRPINPSTLTNADLYVSGPDGTKLPATILPAADGMSAMLFITNPMPGASLVTLTVDGSQIKAADGTLLDAADTGTPGSVLHSTFTTVSETAVPGTTLTGIVADTGPDLIPDTRDNVLAGPDHVLGTADDVYLRPIQGVQVYIIGKQDQAVATDSQGRFTLTSVPAGDVKLVIEGNGAGVMTYDPTSQQFVDPRANGYFFPEMVMDLNVRPGVANTVMGSMGTISQQEANTNNLGVFLPRLQTSILHNAGGNTAVTIPLQLSSSQGLTPQQAAGYSITVTPNSLIGFDGNPLASGQVGFSTVSQSLVRDMLPQGVTQLSSTLTIQAPNVAAFNPPLQLTFANIYDAAPGSKLNVYSFNHTTGMLEVTGTATVSADGKTAATDPGSGISHPGWFGTTPPGDCGGSGGPPPLPAKTQTQTPQATAQVQDTGQLTVEPIFTGESGTIDIPITATGQPSNSSSASPPSANTCNAPTHSNTNQPYTEVAISIQGPLASMFTQTGDFILQAGTDTYHLDAGSTLHLSGSLTPYSTLLRGQGATRLADLSTDELFGSQIVVTKTDYGADGSQLSVEKNTYDVYRFVDTADADHDDMQINFPKALLGVTRSVPIIEYGYSAMLTVAANTDFSVNGQTLTFTPAIGQDNEQKGTLTIQSPDGTQAAPNTIALVGVAAQIQHWYIDPTDFLDQLREDYSTMVFPSILGSLDASQHYQFDPTKAAAVIQQCITFANQKLAAYSQSLDEVSVTATGVPITLPPGVLITATNTSILPTHIIGLTLPAVDNGKGAFLDSTFSTSDIVANRSKYSVPEQNYRLSMALNQYPSESISLFINNMISLLNSDITLKNPTSYFVDEVGSTIAHELGHALGLNHIYVKNDIMFPTYNLGDGQTESFVVTDPAIRVSLGMAYDDAPGPQKSVPQQAIDYYAAYSLSSVDSVFNKLTSSLAMDATSNLAMDTTSGLPTDTDETPFTPGIGIADVQSAADGTSVGSSLDFGSVSLGGAGNTLSFVLQNVGDKPLNISSFSITGSSQFIVSGLTPQVLAPTATESFTITFMPNEAGPASATFLVNNDGADAGLSINLTGMALATGPSVVLSAAQNNLGGVAVGASTQNAQLATVTNQGAQPLTISNIQFESGNASFALLGIPANLATNPITLATGQTFMFGVQYTASKVGLERAKIDISTNDPNHPIKTLGVDGTGLGSVVYPHWGDDYVAIAFPDQQGSPALRTVSDDAGNFNFVLPPSTRYHIAIFDPITGLIANGYGTTPLSGHGIDLTRDLVFAASTAPDTDGDGLPDDVEFAIGTSPTNAFTAGDGIDDFTHVILAHTDPLDGRAFPTGVIASLSLPGTAQGLAVQGSTANPNQQTAYVALGTQGLAIVDATQFDKPVLLGELPGDSQDVAVDPTGQVAAVAAGSAGLNLVNVSNPAAPRLAQTVALNQPAVAVTISEGLAIVASGPNLISIDTATGQVVQTLLLNGDILTGLARDGTRLVTMDASKNLHVVDVDDGLLVSRGSLTLTDGAGKIFTGNGLAYVAATSNLRGGFLTVDLTNPDHPKLASTSVGSTALAAGAFAANGSGLGLEVGDRASGDVLDLFNIADPTKPGQFLTSISLSGSANAVAIASGIAYVADGSGGLQVVNYEPFDTAGKPPTVSISTPLADADPSTPGFQVAGGTQVPIQVQANDDVQVSRVELLVNGQVVSDQVSFPYDLSVIIPNPTPQVSTFDVQVRATDTGGNSTLSNVLSLISVPDTLPPAILQTSPSDGSSVAISQRTVTIDFSKPLAAATVTTANFQLLDPQGHPVPLTNLGLRNGDRTVQLTFSQLTGGAYQVVINAPAVTDTAGVALGTANVVSHFSVVSHTINWTGAAGDGDWDNAANWDLGRIPTNGDDVVINVPGNVTVTLPVYGNLSLDSLVCKDSMVFEATGVLSTITLAGASEIDGRFTYNGFNEVSLVVNGLLTLKGNSTLQNCEISGNGGLLNEGTLNLSGTDGETLATTLSNAGTIIHTGTSGAFFNGGALYLNAGAIIDNLAGGVYEFADDYAAIDSNGSNNALTGTFMNEGTVRKSQGTGVNPIQVQSFVNNGGSFDIQTGNVALDATVTNPGKTFVVTGAGALELNGDNSGTSSTYTGTFNGSGGGNVVLGSASSSGSLTVGAAGATFNFPAGMLQLNFGFIDATAGTLTNKGTLTVDGTSISGEFDNFGTVLQTGSLGVNAGGSLTIVNETGGVFKLQGDDVSTSFTAFNNQGSLEFATATAGAQINFGGTTFDNSGSFTVDTGHVQLSANLSTTSTNFDVNNGATLYLYNDTNYLPGQTISGTYTGSGGGQVVIEANLVAGATGTTFNFPSGMLSWDFGTLDGGTAGFTNAGSLHVIGHTSFDGNPILFLSGLLTNAGTITHTGAGPLFFNTGATLVNQAGGIYDFQDDQAAIQPANNNTTSTFRNQGTVMKSQGPGSGDYSVGATFSPSILDNSGTLEVESGTLHIGSTVSQVSNNTLTGGTWIVINNSNAEIDLSNVGSLTTNGANVTLSGNGARFPAINGLTNNTGGFSLLAGASFTTQGPLTNSGTSLVGPASVLTVNGAFSQTSTGTLTLDIGGTPAGGQVGQFNVTGIAALHGTLTLVLVNGFVPGLGASYNLVTYGSASGTFATIVGLNIATGKVFKPTYDTGNLNLTVVAG